ncbi:MAG: DUF192 domain-containing protein [Actinomycetota bacterium]|nr:DUF192 domain-containing protein [Actinomycetota bacterium]
MTRTRVIFAVAFLILSVGCSEQLKRGGAPEPAATSSEDLFDAGTAVIDTDEGSVIVKVELAATPEARAVGLMHRDSLPENAGMVFVYFEPSHVGFYMKNTLIPLSIAYYDEGGKILKILDMEPCEADPCPTYDPGVPYWGALEVNQGAFEEWGVEVGDVIHVS